jgi:signal transduction histidine kinase
MKIIHFGEQINMSGAQQPRSQPLFISWRWRLLLPLFAILLVVAMVGMYSLAAIADSPTTLASESNLLAVEARLQLVRLMFAGLAAALVIAVFVGVSLLLGRVNRVTRVAEALMSGQSDARTGMKSGDEIGVLGRALDRYADHVQERQDALRLSLRRQRREVAHLTSVLEAMPDGIVVQDLDGRVILINDKARELFGAQAAFRSANLRQLTAAVTDALGPSLAPGLYALGDPQRVELEGRMLSAQAAAVMSMTNHRVGTVVVLRDITEEIRRERARDVLLNKLTKEVQTPLSEMGRSGAGEAGTFGGFAREITRHSVALQKLIVEMRELTADLDTRETARGQRPLPLDTLVWAVANEWKQVAQAANLTLQVNIEQPGLYILGDERRLRWAIGNVVDNAVKYTPPGGSIALDIKGEINGMAHMRVRDTGVGIAADELPQVFARFFRGNPITESGRVIRVPGTGQGLTIAKQIVDAHGGSVRIKSTRWNGTAVYFTLPLTAAVSMEMPRMQASHDADNNPVRIRYDEPPKNEE